MKSSNVCLALALLTGKAIARPAPVPSPTHVPVSQDPSPPRPFPKYPLEEEAPSPSLPIGPEIEAAHPFVVTSFPSKYPLIQGNVLEERVPLALSRFLTDGEDEASDPSSPRPFPAGRIVETEDPSPPRPFPPGRISEASDSSPTHIIEPRTPSPLLRTSKGSEAEVNEPSPPELKPRAEDIRLPPNHAHGGYFPPSNPPVSEPTASATPPDHAHGGYFPPSNPPASEPTASATAVESLSAGLDKRRCPHALLHSDAQCAGSPAPLYNTPNTYLPPSSTSYPNATALKTQAAALLAHHLIQPPLVPLVPLPPVEPTPEHHPNHRIPVATAFGPYPTSTAFFNATFTAFFNATSPTFLNATFTTYSNATSPTFLNATSTTLSNATSTIFSNHITTTTTTTTTTTVNSTSTTPPHCTETITKYIRSHETINASPSLDLIATTTIYSATSTITHLVDCHSCSAVIIKTVDLAHMGPHAWPPRPSATATVTVTDPGTTTVDVNECWILPTLI